MGANKSSSISKADSLAKMGEFWDTHDLTDFDDPDAPDVDFDRCIFTLGCTAGVVDGCNLYI